MIGKIGLFILFGLIITAILMGDFRQFKIPLLIAAPIIVWIITKIPFERFFYRLTGHYGFPALFQNLTPCPDLIAKGDYSIIPESIKENAFCAPNGEAAWKKEDLEFVLKEISKKGFAITGSEAWVVEKDKIYGTLLFKDGKHGVCGWSTDSRKEGESWSDYVNRTLELSLKNFSEMDYERDVIPEIINKIYYCVSFIDEAGSQQQPKSDV